MNSMGREGRAGQEPGAPVLLLWVLKAALLFPLGYLFPSQLCLYPFSPETSQSTFPITVFLASYQDAKGQLPSYVEGQWDLVVKPP